MMFDCFKLSFLADDVISFFCCGLSRPKKGLDIGDLVEYSAIYSNTGIIILYHDVPHVWTPWKTTSILIYANAPLRTYQLGQLASPAFSIIGTQQ